ncbi:MAG: hypothetical protein QXF61_03080 [Nitrososphaeria archaeon]
MSKTKMVDIRSLKHFAFEMLPKEAPLRDLLLTEKDEMLAEEFLIKMEIWFKLLRKLKD